MTAQVFRGFDPAMTGERSEQKTAQSNPKSAYTAVELAAVFGVSDATIRTRWLPVIARVAPLSDLKKGRKYTQRCRELMADYASTPNRDSDEWVARYRSDRQESQVFEGEMVDAEIVDYEEECDNALAVRENGNIETFSAIAERVERIKKLQARREKTEAEMKQEDIERRAAEIVLEMVEQQEAKFARDREIEQAAGKLAAERLKQLGL